MTALILELLESFSIGINGTARLLCMTPFGEAPGGDTLADCLLPNVKVSGYSRNRSSRLEAGPLLADTGRGVVVANLLDERVRRWCAFAGGLLSPVLADTGVCD